MLSVDQVLRLIALPAVVVALLIASQISSALNPVRLKFGFTASKPRYLAALDNAVEGPGIKLAVMQSQQEPGRGWHPQL